MAYAIRETELPVNPYQPFMDVVETVRQRICPRSPGSSALSSGKYVFYSPDMQYISHILEPVARVNQSDHVRTVRLTSRASPASVEALRAELSGST